MDPYLSAEEKLSQAERLAAESAGELEQASPRLARELIELREWTAAIRRRVAREARQQVAA
jgi:hypothetical protein